MKNLNSIRIITATLGVILALSGIFPHGFYEILQGNKSTDGFYINSIGEEHVMWEGGTDPALTIIPNFLVTGIFAVCISIFIIIWSIFFVHKSYGRIIFLLSFIVLVLVGGGIGFIVFFLPTWAYSTRMNKPLKWWRKILRPKLRAILSKIWIYALIISCICFLIGNLISVFGYVPGVKDPEAIFNICWTFLIISLVFINLTFISGLAHNIESEKNPEKNY